MDEEKLRIVRFSDMGEPKPLDKSQALPASELSWEKIVEIEPRLEQAEIELSAMSRKGGKPFCANLIWYGYLDCEFSYKARVNRYVGWSAEAPELCSMEAYDIAYEHLYELLPPCRDCMCFGSP